AFTVKSRAARSSSSVGARQSVTSRHIPWARTRAAPRSGSSGTNAPPRRAATRAARSSAPDSTATSRSARAACRPEVSRASRTAPATITGDRERPAAEWTARSTARAGGARCWRVNTAGLATRGRRGRRPDTSTTGLAELDASSADPVLDDLVAHRAAAMLGAPALARRPITDARAAEDQDRVRGGADVAGGDLARQQVLQPRLLGRHQEQGRERRVVVAMRVDELAVLPHRQAYLHPERLGVA